MSSDAPDEPDTPAARLGVIIIAAGRGTRMKSRLNKVLHPVLGLPIIAHVLRTATALQPSEIVVVAGVDTSDIRAMLPEDVRLAIQQHPLGTADAVAAGVDVMPESVEEILILNGDVPLVTASSLRRLIEERRTMEATLTVAGFSAPAASRYGRIAYRNGRVARIIEAAEDDRSSHDQIEANGGVYAFRADWLREHIGSVRVSASGEYYLTSLVAMAAGSRPEENAVVSVAFEAEELVGVDDRVRLAEAERVLGRRMHERLMRGGVTIVDPERTVIEVDVRIARDVRIEPGTILRGRTSIGSGSVIGPYSVLEDATVGENSTIVHSWLTGAEVGSNVDIGPYSHMRPGSRIEDDVHIGNYVETKAARIGSGTRIGHFSYVGDATVGTNVNVGAGTITCNYDGVQKHHTTIGNGVFLGSDTMLVAPVELGDGSRTGAGAVVTRSVPPGKTVVGVPARQISTGVRTENGEHGR